MSVSIFKPAVIGLTMGIAAAVSATAPRATAQPPSATSAWESKAVAFSKDAAQATKTLNQLAADGWEYVGPLTGNLVAFKRLRGLAGMWDGDDWGIAGIKATKDGYEGTYTSTINQELGSFTLKEIAPGKYKGIWWESGMDHHGSVEMQVSKDLRTGHVVWKALDKDPKRGTSLPTGGKSTWKRFRGQAIVDTEFANLWWR
ncbi:MAG: hypothetical protein ACE5KM_01805 [Planctomycetaceae bacterium]